MYRLSTVPVKSKCLISYDCDCYAVVSILVLFAHASAFSSKVLTMMLWGKKGLCVNI